MRSCPASALAPVSLGGSVQDAVNHLGEPNRVNRSRFRGPGYSSDEVTYFYDDECISFTWEDSGLDPKIESGLRGINVSCNRWSLSNGIRVGSTMQELNATLGHYCPSTNSDGKMFIESKDGIWYDNFKQKHAH